MKTFCFYLTIFKKTQGGRRLSLHLNVSWDYFVTAIDWKIHISVAWNFSNSLFLLLIFWRGSFVINRRLECCMDFHLIEKSTPTLHVPAMRSCYSMNKTIQWKLYFKDITYKKVFLFFLIGTISFFQSNLLIFATETCWTMHAF